MALPDPNPEWTAPERWAWERITAGEVADFHARDAASGAAPLDPRQDSDKRWDEPDRAIRSAFLVDILARAPWRDAVPFQGVRLAGARVDGDLHLAHARLGRQFWLERSLLRGAVRGMDMRVDGWLSLEGSTVIGAVDLSGIRATAFSMAGGRFDGRVDLRSAAIGGNLILGPGAGFADVVVLSFARIEDDLLMTGSTFEKSVEANTIRVKGSAFMAGGSRFRGTLDFGVAKIGQNVDLVGAACEGDVSLRDAEVAGSVFMREKATFKGAVDLGWTRVGTSVDMADSTFEGAVSAGNIDVRGTVFMNAGAAFRAAVNFASASIGGDLDLTGSTFAGDVGLRSARIGGYAHFQNKARFDGTLDLAFAKVGRAADFASSEFRGRVDANSIEIAGTAFMNRGAVFRGPVDLSVARVGRHVDLRGATVEGPLSLRNAHVADSVFMREKATFKGPVDLAWARIGGSVELTGSIFEGAITASDVVISGSLFMSRGSAFKDAVTLHQARIDGQADVSSEFDGRVSFESIRVGHDLFLRGGKFKQPIHAIFAVVGRNLDLSGATLPGVDLSSARIAGELRIGSSIHRAPAWGDGALLNLRGARAGAIQDRRDGSSGAGGDGWPARLELDGFAFERLGGFAAEGKEADFAQRDSAWFAGWLARDVSYSPQPYVQLAEVLRRAGEPGKANDVLFAGRQRARAEAWRRGRHGTWAAMTVLRLAIGYGIGRRYANALLCVMAATLIGAAVLSASPEAAAKGWVWMIGASLDQMLPIVELNKEFGEFFNDPARKRLGDWQLTYFAFQSLLGYVLGSFVVAGIAGLTQKP